MHRNTHFKRHFTCEHILLSKVERIYCPCSPKVCWKMRNSIMMSCGSLVASWLHRLIGLCSKMIIGQFRYLKACFGEARIPCTPDAGAFQCIVIYEENQTITAWITLITTKLCQAVCVCHDTAWCIQQTFTTLRRVHIDICHKLMLLHLNMPINPCWGIMYLNLCH